MELKQTILLIDTELESKKILEAVLSPAYKLVIADNGKKAYNWLLDGNTPLLIILKYSDNKLFECEFIHQIRTSSYFKSLKTLLMSKTKPNFPQNSFCLADDFIKTPLKPNILFDKIEKLTGVKVS